MEKIIVSAQDKGYVQTHWGRRRYVPNIYEKNRALYEEARRVAINSVVQGTAAEIMKQGMINLVVAAAFAGLTTGPGSAHDRRINFVPIKKMNIKTRN